jgi:hypothetical protein
MAIKKKISKKPVKSTKVSRKPQKQHPKHFLKVYWPYIPILLVVTFSMIFGSVIPRSQTDQPATLAYSTEMGTGNLLSGTNAERTSRGLVALTINPKLNSSAAAKAADMRDRDYWAHNTPDGQEPWIFFDAAGYNYQKAGENLAYGFGSSSATITGWMNSPSHRDNMLDASYTEVGFGFVNSPDFVNTGEETIVVAHYGKPVNAPAPQPVAAEPQSLPASNLTPAVPAEIAATPEPEPQPLDASRINQPISTASPVPNDTPSTNITRLQQLTNGDAPWSAVALSIGALAIVVIWIVRHALLVKRFVLYGEHFVAHHPLLDLVVVSIAAIAVYLTQSSGVVL